MRTLIAISLAFACAQQNPPPVASPDYTLLIRGGRVIDGTGSPARQADLGIRGDTIAAIGDLRSATADTTIDAASLVVAPGFIDLLGNSQAAVLLDPRLE